MNVHFYSPQCECENWNTQPCTFLHLFLMFCLGSILYRQESRALQTWSHPPFLVFIQALLFLGWVEITCWKASLCTCQHKQHVSHAIPTFPHSLNNRIHTWASLWYDGAQTLQRTENSITIILVVRGIYRKLQRRRTKLHICLHGAAL